MVLHCFYCDNIDEALIGWHKSACFYAGIPVKYHTASIAELEEKGISPHAAHGLWMERVLEDSKNKIVGFIDIDCIISSRDWLENYYKQVQENKTILGLAQCANHLASRDQIYAAPAFCLIWREWWNKIGKPSLVADWQYDTAQRLSANAADNEEPITVLMPSHVTRPKWSLGNNGFYGTGTLYDDHKIFHMFECSKGALDESIFWSKLNQLSSGANVFQP